VAEHEGPAGAAQAPELDLPTLDDDERVPPFGVVDGPLASRWDDDHPKLE
jgi:hypothetical protein